MILPELIQGCRSLLFPTACLLCQKPLSEAALSICAPCLKELPWSSSPWRKQVRGDFFDQAISLFDYEGNSKELVAQLKYHGRLSLVPLFGRLLAEMILNRLGPDPADGVVPVPLHPTRLRERTFNQADHLAQELAGRLDLPCRADLLTRWRPTRPQTELSREERLNNLKGAFSLRSDPLIRCSRILLVDDVLTTGATVNACAQLLKQGGAAQVIAATLAHG